MLQHIETFRYMNIITKEENIVKIAKALSDKTRLRILEEISKNKSMTCGETEKIAGLSQPTVSHHLKILYEAGLLEMEKEGRFVRITVNKKAFDEFNQLIKLTINK